MHRCTRDVAASGRSANWLCVGIKRGGRLTPYFSRPFVRLIRFPRPPESVFPTDPDRKPTKCQNSPRARPAVERKVEPRRKRV